MAVQCNIVQQMTGSFRQLFFFWGKITKISMTFLSGLVSCFQTSWYITPLVLDPQRPALLALSEVGLYVQLYLTLADIE